MALPPRLNRLGASVRRLASKGWSADAIVRVYPTLTRPDVRAILASPERPPRLAREIRGRMGTRIRRLVAEGLPPSAIAEALNLDPATLAEFLDRLVSRQGKPLSRPRSRGEQAALSDRYPGSISGRLPPRPPSPSCWTSRPATGSAPSRRSAPRGEEGTGDPSTPHRRREGATATPH